MQEGDANEEDALVADGDVRVAIKRIVGTDLWAEGVCELVRRGEDGGEGKAVVSPARKGRASGRFQLP